MPKPSQRSNSATAWTRRGFLVAMTAGGAAGFGFARQAASPAEQASPAARLAADHAAHSQLLGSTGQALPPQDPAAAYEPTLWYAMAPDGIVTVNIIRAEMGQHVGTAIARILADELEVPWDRIRVQHVDSDPRWGVMATGGSWSVSQSWLVYRQAGAAGRIALIEAAASHWGVPTAQCIARDGEVRSGVRRLSYGELVGMGLSRHFSADELKTLKLKPDSDLQLVGRPVTALDIDGKTTGRAVFGIDARVDGMVYGWPLLPPTRYGSKVTQVDDSAARSIPGYQKTLVLDDPSGNVPGWAMVIASDFFAARRAAPMVKVSWTAGPGADVSEEDLIARGRALIRDPSLGSLLDTGDSDTGPVFKRAAQTLEAEYITQTVLHFQLEPVNALVFRNADGVWEVHTGNQWQSLALPWLAKALAVEETQVLMRTYLIGGGFGRRLNGDYAIPAALASKALGGKPVKMMLMRPDDVQFDSPRSASVQQLRMAFDGHGKPIAMEHHAAAGWPTEAMVPAFVPKGANGKPVDPSASAGADHWYSVGAQKARAISLDLANQSFRPGWLRSVGPGWTNWAVESFMDEAAHKAGRDPLQFRLELLTGEGRNAGSGPIAQGGALRQAAVLRRAAELIGWGSPQPADTGLGLASTFGQEREMPTWVACGVQVHVDRTNGLVHVQRLRLVVDAGIIVDPDGALAQCQGGALWGLSMALYEGSALAKGRFRDSNLDTYTPLRIAQVPDLKIEFIDSPHAPAGLGEPAVTPVAPAIANAIEAAVGIRLRTLPMTPEAVKLALQAPKAAAPR